MKLLKLFSTFNLSGLFPKTNNAKAISEFFNESLFAFKVNINLVLQKCATAID
jgi:hypothetical protein